MGEGKRGAGAGGDQLGVPSRLMRASTEASEALTDPRWRVCWRRLRLAPAMEAAEGADGFAVRRVGDLELGDLEGAVGGDEVEPRPCRR